MRCSYLFSWLALPIALTLSCASASSGGPSGSNGSTEDSGDKGGTDTGEGVADSTPPADADPATDGATLGEYPPGPYGTSTGSILADFAITGYLELDPTQLATKAEYKTIKLSDLRAAAKVPYLFIHEVGFF